MRDGYHWFVRPGVLLFPDNSIPIILVIVSLLFDVTPLSLDVHWHTARGQSTYWLCLCTCVHMSNLNDFTRVLIFEECLVSKLLRTEDA